MIGGNVDLDILSLFPQKQESMEGLRVIKLEEGQQQGKNTSSKDEVEWGRRPPFIGAPDPTVMLTARRERYYRSKERYYR